MFAKIQALGDPTRYAILRLVRDGERRAGDIAGHFKTLTRPAISQHLRVLKENDLLQERRDGTKRLYRLNPAEFENIQNFLHGFWEVRLEKLKQVVEQEARTKRSRRKS